MSKAYNPQWRKRHPDRWRELRKKNYARGRVGCYRHKARWSMKEDSQILAKGRPPDRVLAQLLGRSVQAIQGRRVVLRRSNK